MSTLLDRVNRVRTLLQDTPRQATLTADMATSDTTLTVDDVSFIGQDSRIEIDNEIMLVTTDPSNLTLTVQRGYEGTTIATHNGTTSPAKVLIDPRFNKANIINAINVALGQWCTSYFPRLVWDDGVTAGTFSPIKWIVPAPEDALKVLQVSIQFPAGYTRLQPVAHGPLETFPPSMVAAYSDGTPGKGFRLYQYDFIAGFTIRVLYGKAWTNLVNDTDVVDADFPITGDDLIDQGALLYLVGLHNVPRFRMSEIATGRELSQPIPTIQTVQQLDIMAKKWAERADMVRKNRPVGNEPQTIWVGRQ